MLPGTAFQSEEHQPFYWQAGQPAALLVHGFPGTPAEVRPLAQAFRRAGWSVQGMLLPGFGPQIETLPGRRCADWTDAVAEALAALKRRHHPVVLVGYSLGGALALQAAARAAPDALVLLSPFWKLEHVLWMLLPALKRVLPGVRPFRLLKMDFSDPEVRAGIHNFMPDADLDDPAVQQAIRDFRLPLELFAQIRQAGMLAYRSAPRISPALPALVIQGDADDLVRPSLTRQLAQRLPAPPRYVEVPARHDLLLPDKPAWPQIEQTVLRFSMDLLQSQPAESYLLEQSFKP